MMNNWDGPSAWTATGQPYTVTYGDAAVDKTISDTSIPTTGKQKFTSHYPPTVGCPDLKKTVDFWNGGTDGNVVGAALKFSIVGDTCTGAAGKDYPLKAYRTDFVAAKATASTEVTALKVIVKAKCTAITLTSPGDQTLTEAVEIGGAAVEVDMALSQAYDKATGAKAWAAECCTMTVTSDNAIGTWANDKATVKIPFGGAYEGGEVIDITYTHENTGSSNMAGGLQTTKKTTILKVTVANPCKAPLLLTDGGCFPAPVTSDQATDLSEFAIALTTAVSALAIGIATILPAPPVITPLAPTPFGGSSTTAEGVDADATKEHDDEPKLNEFYISRPLFKNGDLTPF